MREQQRPHQRHSLPRFDNSRRKRGPWHSYHIVKVHRFDRIDEVSGGERKEKLIISFRWKKLGSQFYQDDIIYRNYTAVTAAISNLLLLALKIYDDKDPYVCPFNLRAPQHPLITVLSRNKDIWRDVLNQMQFMVNHYRRE